MDQEAASQANIQCDGPQEKAFSTTNYAYASPPGTIEFLREYIFIILSKPGIPYRSLDNFTQLILRGNQ